MSAFHNLSERSALTRDAARARGERARATATRALRRAAGTLAWLESQGTPHLGASWCGCTQSMGGGHWSRCTHARIVMLAALALLLLVRAPAGHGSTGLAVAPPAVLSADLAIYGATVCGVTAAVGGSRTNPNATVVLLVNGSRLGGMTSGGLGGRDAQKILPLGGLAGDLWAPLCSQSAGGACGFEPHAAEESAQSLLSTAPNVIVRRNTGWLQAVGSAGSYPRQIRSITTQSGLVVHARQWIDCSYEGDLLRLSGTDFAVGREARSEYNESTAGVDGQTHPQVGVDQTPSMFAEDVSPWTDETNATLLPGIVGLQNYSDAQAGEADDWVQSFCFRLCLTTRQNNSLPILPPADYTAATMELLRRQILSDTKRGVKLHMRDTTVDGKLQRGMFLVRDLPNDKIDLNSGAFSDSPFSTDLPFLQHGWPTGGPQERYALPSLSKQRLLCHVHQAAVDTNFIRTVSIKQS